MAVVVQDVARAEASVIEGLVAPTGDETEVRIHMCNTGEIATARVLSPGGRVSYERCGPDRRRARRRGPGAVGLRGAGGSDVRGAAAERAGRGHDRRRRLHADRQGHALRDPRRGRHVAARRRDPRGAGRGRGAEDEPRLDPPAGGPADGARRCGRAIGAEDDSGLGAADGRRHRHPQLHPPPVPRHHRRLRGGERGHRLHPWRGAGGGPRGTARGRALCGRAPGRRGGGADPSRRGRRVTGAGTLRTARKLFEGRVFPRACDP